MTEAPLPQLPIVLIHGFTDAPKFTGTWKAVETLLQDAGIEFLTPTIPRFGSIEERSQSLTKQIREAFPGRSVHLFGQSMVRTTILVLSSMALRLAVAFQGGLNARDIAAKDSSENGFTVKTVTTFVRSCSTDIEWN